MRALTPSPMHGAGAAVLSITVAESSLTSRTSTYMDPIIGRKHDADNEHDANSVLTHPESSPGPASVLRA
jgi:hypothetical protein